MSESSIWAALFARMSWIAETVDAENADHTLLTTSDANLQGRWSV